MAKTPQQWRSEWVMWRKMGNPWLYDELLAANCVLGYAMARGWYHV